nr:hotdog fold thioesterase [Bogoriella caseilytica]
MEGHTDGTLVGKLGLEFVAAGPEEVVARMPVEGNRQYHGVLHGGASAALAETLGSVAASLAAGDGRVAVGMELSVTHHRPASAGYVTGRATPLHLGRRTATYEIAVTDDHGKRVCTARLTCMMIEAP